MWKDCLRKTTIKEPKRTKKTWQIILGEHKAVVIIMGRRFQRQCPTVKFYVQDATAEPAQNGFILFLIRY